MRNRFFVCSLMVAAALGTPSRLIASPAALVLGERRPHERIWTRINEDRTPNGHVLQRTSTVVEMATGMHFWKDGAWHEANEQIELFDQGAVARNGQHQVIFAPDLNTEGAIDLQSPDGKRFRSHILGIAFTDAKSGDSVLIAEGKESLGEVFANQVTYRDAFAGAIKAHVRYTYTRTGLEQDVVLIESPPSPAIYGMDPGTTRLEIWTEFLTPPLPTVRTIALSAEADPVKRAAMQFPDFTDDTLDFGAMSVGGGRAFWLEQPVDSSVPVGKTWLQIEGRHFLIEAVEFSKLAPLLQQLPQGAAGARLLPKQRKEFARALHRPKPLLKQKPKTMLAGLPLSGRAVVLDYQQLNSSLTNYVFSAQYTYWITAPVLLYGPSNILEGGTVLKFDPNVGATIDVKGILRAETDVYRPAVLTARDDLTMGELITEEPPVGYYASPALNFDYSVSGQPAALQNIRVLFADTAVQFTGGAGHELRHVQIGNSANAVRADNARYAIRNALAWNLTNAMTGSGVSTGAWENATFDGLTNLISSTAGRFTNCLVTSVGNTNGIVGSSNVVLASSAGVYKTVAGGAHYLSDSSPYRNKGATNINATLAKELKERTTFAPLVLTNLITADTTLAPQVAEDTNQVDVGYHYAPLDFFVSGVVVSNATVWATNGVVIGIDYTNSQWGFILQQGKFHSIGTAQTFNYLSRAHMAQELSGGNIDARACFYDAQSAAGSRDCAVRLRFTRFSQLIEDGYLLYIGTKFGALEFTHSQMYNQSIVLVTTNSGTLICGLTNTYWERGGLILGLSAAGPDVTVHLRNNLFRNVGSFHFVGGNTNWTVRDNLFDTVALDDHSSPVQNSYNAYYCTTNPLSGGVNDLNLPSLSYEIGPLGKYYQPSSSLLINAGSRTAALAGLYHFTTTTNQVPETNSVVDIGLHYVALNAQGQPTDTDADGIPDYIEDINGNGTWEPGETPWFVLPPFNVLITAPDPNAILP